MFAFWSLLSLSAFGFVLAGVGIWRGRVVSIPSFAFVRSEQPTAFWVFVVGQSLLGLMCLLAAIDELVPFGFAELLGVPPDKK